jgi:hypothetical protein
MAIKITIDKLVKPIRPQNGKTFNVDELNDMVGGWIEPFKVGPVWVMTAEKSREKGAELNDLASYFFEVALHGEVLIVPPQQLPSDWEVMEDDDKKLSADMVDSGFLLSLQNALMVKKMREQNPSLQVNATDFFNSHFNVSPKEEYTYEPPIGEDIDENTADFLSKVFEYMKTAPSQFKNGILLDESQVTIRTQKGNIKTILDMMKGMYLENEEYEKCAVIQQVEDQIK